MALPGSGQISLSQVAGELQRSAGTQTSLGESAVRTLAGIASGQIALSNLWGKSNVQARGYWFGGAYVLSNNFQTRYNTIQGIEFSNESQVAVAATLADAKYYLGDGTCAPTNCYVAGGWNYSANTNVIENFNLTTESCGLLSATMPSAFNSYATFGTSTNGYEAAGGYAYTNSSAIVRLSYSALTTATLAATLAAGTKNTAAGASSSTNGYTMCGSVSGVSSSAIDKMSFASETESMVSATMPIVSNVVTASAATSKNNNAAYLFGNYYSGSPCNQIEKFNMANESTGTLSATLASGRSGVGTSNSLDRAYSAGGYSTAGSCVNEIDGLVFSNESANNPAAALSTLPTYHAAGQAFSYGP